jgi:hypothetical protein
VVSYLLHACLLPATPPAPAASSDSEAGPLTGRGRAYSPLTHRRSRSVGPAGDATTRVYVSGRSGLKAPGSGGRHVEGPPAAVRVYVPRWVGVGRWGWGGVGRGGHMCCRLEGLTVRPPSCGCGHTDFMAQALTLNGQSCSLLGCEHCKGKGRLRWICFAAGSRSEGQLVCSGIINRLSFTS